MGQQVLRNLPLNPYGPGALLQGKYLIIPSISSNENVAERSCKLFTETRRFAKDLEKTIF
jgi:hypothetical protein